MLTKYFAPAFLYRAINFSGSHFSACRFVAGKLGDP